MEDGAFAQEKEKKVSPCPACGCWYSHYHWGATNRYYGYLESYRPGVPFAGRNDEEIGRDLRDVLFWDARVDSRGIKMTVDNGVVTLGGIVSSPVAKKAAEDDAWDISGVLDVKNELAIHH